MALGLRGSGSWGSDERPKSYREGILYRHQNAAPLTALLNRMKQEECTDPEFKIFTKNLPLQRIKVNGTQSDTAQLFITVDTAAGAYAGAFGVRKGHILKNQTTGEKFYVSADPSSDTSIPVVRSWGSVAASTITDDDILWVIGTTNEEGSAYPSAVYSDPTVTTNYCQIFRDSLELTNTGAAIELRTGKPLVEAKRETLERHAIQMEKAFFFGEAIQDTSGSQPKRTTGGLDNFVTTNVTDFASTSVSIDGWETFLRSAFQFESKEKIAFCGDLSLDIINKIARNHSQIMSDVSKEMYGVNCQKWQTPFGTLGLINHPLLRDELNDWLYVVDPKNLVYRYLRGRDTQYLTNRQNPGDDKVVHEFLTECGLEIRHEAAFAIAQNMTAFVA
jgi:hypothetical protein